MCNIYLAKVNGPAEPNAYNDGLRVEKSKPL